MEGDKTVDGSKQKSIELCFRRRGEGDEDDVSLEVGGWRKHNLPRFKRVFGFRMG